MSDAAKIEDKIRELERSLGQVDLDATNSTPRPTERTFGDSWTFRPISTTDPADELRPTILRVKNSAPLFYEHDLNSLIGEPNLGKSWILLHAAAEVLADGRRVLWIDYEEPGQRKLRSRLRTLGVPVEHWGNLHHVNPSEQLWSRERGSSTPTYANVRDQLRKYDEPYGLVVIDAMAGLLSTEGLDENKTEDVEQAYRTVRTLFIDEGGSTVVASDHVTKAKDTRGRWAIGSQRKISGITGATYYLQVSTPWRRATVEPVRGSASLIVSKDRQGVRAVGDTAAAVEVVATPDGFLDIRLTNPKDVVNLPSDDDVKAVVNELRLGGANTKTALRKECEMGDDRVKRVLTWLVEQSAATTKPHPNGGAIYTLVETKIRDLGY